MVLKYSKYYKMQEKQFTVSYSPSSSAYNTVAYAVDSSALYAKVVSIQIANISTSDRTLIMRWGAHADRAISSTLYWGDGLTVRQHYYTYETYSVLDEGYLPAGASLSVLDKEMFLQPKDFVTIKPSVADKMTTLISVVEYFGDEITDVETRKTDYDQVRVDFEGDIY
jgi:hypothetical protein